MKGDDSMNAEDEYIDKAECIRRGYIKKKRVYFKMSVLEKYVEKGWLDYGDKRYRSNDRIKAAERLQSDFENSRFMASGSIWSREKVDNCGKNTDDIEAVCQARERYLAAAKSVPHEFWFAVQKVCLQNEDLEADKEIAGRRRTDTVYALKCDLCRGLDRLIKFYWPS